MPTPPNFNGTKKSTRSDDAGMIYRDIAFVPSGTLAMKRQTSTADMSSSNVTNRKAEAASVSEFYRSVLSIPTTATPPTIKKRSRTTRREVAGTRVNTTTAESISQRAAAGSLPRASLISLPSDPSTKGVVSTDTIDETIRRNWQIRPAAFSRDPADNSTSRGHDVEGGPVLVDDSAVDGSDKLTERRTVTPGYVLCEACQIEVREADWDRHQSGTAHLMSKDSPTQPLDRLKLGHENKGFRMLVNSGWEYEKGLGAQGQGVRHPVATRLKHDRLALGAASTSKKVVTHTFEEIEASRSKPSVKSNTRVPLNAEDYRRKAVKDNKDRVNLMAYMKSS